MRYQIRMARHQKLIEQMRNNPRDWRIGDLESIADRLGISHDQEGTSHLIFRRPDGVRLSVPAHRPIKPVYVKQFLAFIEDMKESE
jgi:hypothetical protein